MIFQDKGNRIVCERIEFDVRRQQAILYGARGELGRKYKISGERLERQEVNHYWVQGGSISTCQGPIPEWQFRFDSMDVTLEEFAFIRHPTFWVLGFPIGYLPFLIAPIKTKRSTGFWFLPSGTAIGTGSGTTSNFLGFLGLRRCHVRNGNSDRAWVDTQRGGAISTEFDDIRAGRF